MNRRALRFGAVIGATALTALAIAPAFAAATVAQSTASALTLSIGGQSAYSGEVSATNDGTKETKTGDAQPPISVLGNQKLVNVGVLVQDAITKITGQNGTSAACAGAAGNGGSTSPLANVGDSSCITPGNPIGVNLANLDLSDVVTIDPKSALGPLAQLNAPLGLILTAITKPLSDALAGALGGATGLAGSLGAIEARCTAAPGKADGTANIVDSKLMLNVAGTEVVLVNLPAHPAKNTHLLTNLDGATQAILDAVQTQLQTMLANAGAGPLAPLAALPKALQDQVITTLVEALREPLLKPLEQNVLDVTLNKQVRTGNDKIEVTALDLKLLPAAQQFGIDSLVGLTIGHVTCGPNDRVGDTTPPTNPNNPSTPPNSGPGNGPGDVPTSVDSGMGGHVSTTAILTGTAALMLLAGSAGLIGYRRLLTK